MAEPSGPRATFFQRFGALLIDAILVGIVIAIVQSAVSRSFGSLLGLALGILYYGWLEGSPPGQTIGNRVPGIRVYDFRECGGPTGTSPRSLRSLTPILSARPL